MVFEELVGRELKISLRQGVLFYYFFFPPKNLWFIKELCGGVRSQWSCNSMLNIPWQPVLTYFSLVYVKTFFQDNAFVHFAVPFHYHAIPFPFMHHNKTQLTGRKGKLKCCLVFPHHGAPWELQLAMQRAELCPPTKHKRAALPSRALQHQLPVVAPAEMLTASPSTSVVDSYCYYCSSL